MADEKLHARDVYDRVHLRSTMYGNASPHLEALSAVERAAATAERERVCKEVSAKIEAIVRAPAPVAHGLLDELRAYLRAGGGERG